MPSSVPLSLLSAAERALADALIEVGQSEGWIIVRLDPETPRAEYVLSGVARLLILASAETIATAVVRIDGAADVELRAGVAAGASLTIVTVQQSSDEAVRIVQRAQVGDGASILWQNATFGGAVEQALVSTLTGPHANSAVDWLFYAHEQETQRLSARNEFQAREGGGEMLMQGVAEDKAHVRCDGMILIGLGGGGTQTYLTESVLMLDPTAKVDAIPGLEIRTNDVKASHSATASRVTEEDLFTFAARGIPAAEARQMYIIGFLGAIAGRIVDERVRSDVLGIIEGKYRS